MVVGDLVVSDVEYSANGEPWGVTVRLAHRGLQLASAFPRQLADLASGLHRAASALYRREGVTRPIGSLRGRLFVRNTQTGATVGQSSGTRSITLDELTPDLFREILENITQSDVDVTPYDLAWSWLFYLPDLRGGGAGKLPKGLPTPVKLPLGWTPPLGIHCLAWALTYGLWSGANRNSQTHRIRAAALDHQLQLKWPADGLVVESQIAVYLNAFAPTVRVIVVSSCLRDFRDHTYTGRAWCPPAGGRTAGEAPGSGVVKYLGYDPLQRHYGAITVPSVVLGAGTHVCTTCLFSYTSDRQCMCNNPEREAYIKDRAKRRKLRQSEKCKTCGQRGCKCKYRKFCNVCGSPHSPHRCLSLYKIPDSKAGFLTGEFDKTAPQYTLWAWDIESILDFAPLNREGEELLEKSFQLDPDTHTYRPDLPMIEVQRRTHCVNLIMAKSHLGVMKKWKLANPLTPMGEDDYENPIEAFLAFMTKGWNDGYNLCFAHNASGYDNKLLLEGLLRMRCTVRPSVISRGVKHIQIKLGNCYFRDSLHFLKGSLAKLGGEMFPGKLAKGFYPYFFNTHANNARKLVYMPALGYFDLSSIMKSPKDLAKFMEWYNARVAYERIHGPSWCPQGELEMYCANDVEVLLACMLAFHEAFAFLKLSPFHFPTLPSFVSKAIRGMHYPSLELEASQPGTDERQDALNELVKREWIVSTDVEYYFARLALYGGRTDARCIHYRISDAAWAAGHRMYYDDVKSLYPSGQLRGQYPTGEPVIEIYNTDYYPCTAHCRPRYQGRQAIFSGKPYCECTLSSKTSPWWPGRNVNDIRILTEQPTAASIRDDKTFYGIVCVDITPPRTLFHPVLVTHVDGKTVATLEPLKGYVCTTDELRVALLRNYKLERVHRLDRYAVGEPIWNAFLRHAIVEKERNGNDDPTPAEREALVRGYEAFGMADAIRASFPWSKKPALKLSNKIAANCCWGKECQNPLVVETDIFSADHEDDFLDWWADADQGHRAILDITVLGNKTVGKSTNSLATNVRPRLNDFYLPAGLFVPARGRLVLLEAMHKLDRRLFYNDTDSVIYLHVPGLPDIEQGHFLGCWEPDAETVAHGHIREFVAWAPKSYAMLYGDGTTKVVMKGVSMNLATAPLLTFEIMRDQVLKFLRGGHPDVIQIPQTTFRQDVGRQMESFTFLKSVSFQPGTLKGTLSHNILFPPGFCHACKPGVPCCSEHHA